MSYFWKKALLACGLTTAIIMPSCKKESSGDDPLPITYDPSVIIASDNQFVYAYDPKSGKKHWELFLSTPIEASPLLVDTCVYIAGLDGNLYKIDAKRGTLLKTLKDFPFSQFKGTPIVHDKLIYLPSTNDTLYCLENDAIKWKFSAGADIVSSPTITPDNHVVFGAVNGKMYCLNSLDGIIHWTFEPSPATSFVSSPVSSGKFIFIGGLDNNMYAVVNEDGSQKWSFPTGFPIYSSPLIYGASCLFGSDDFKFYCVDTATGLHRWTNGPVQTGDRIQSSPFAKDNVIYVGSYDQHMYAINILNGQVKWKYKTSGLIKSSPVLYDGILYFGSDDKFLYALDPVLGKPRWVQNIGGLIHCSPMVDDLTGKSYNSSVSGMPIQ
jgi:outer membrane protein assembly factor BamB